MTDKVRCKAKVSGEGRWGSFHQHQCERSAQDGKEFCKTHDPKLRQEKYDEQDKKWRVELEKRRELQALFWDNSAYVRKEKGNFEVVFTLSEEGVRELAEKLR